MLAPVRSGRTRLRLHVAQGALRIREDHFKPWVLPTASASAPPISVIAITTNAAHVTGEQRPPAQTTLIVPDAFSALALKQMGLLTVARVEHRVSKLGDRRAGGTTTRLFLCLRLG